MYYKKNQTGNMVLCRVFPVVSQGTAAKKNAKGPNSIFHIDHNTKTNVFKTAGRTTVT